MHDLPRQPESPEESPAESPTPGEDAAGVVLSDGSPLPVAPSGSGRVPADRQALVGEMWVWIGVLIVIAVLGGLLVMRYRRTLFGAEEPLSDGTEGLMRTLRAMRDRGEISQEEFDATKRRMVEKIRSSPAGGRRAGRREKP